MRDIEKFLIKALERRERPVSFADFYDSLLLPDSLTKARVKRILDQLAESEVIKAVHLNNKLTVYSAK